MPGVRQLALSRRAVAAIVVTAILLWSGAFFLWSQAGLDKWLLISHNGLRTNDLVIAVAQAASSYGMSVILLVYLLYLSFAFRHEPLRDAYGIYLVVLLMFGIAGMGGDLLKEVFDRTRPFVEYAGEINTPSAARMASFPSGHATKSVALALPFLFLLPVRDDWHRLVKVLPAMLALAVCYSRVVLGVHYVSDVLAGIGMALICFPFVTRLTSGILGRMTSERVDVAVKIWGGILLGMMIVLAVL